MAHAATISHRPSVFAGIANFFAAIGRGLVWMAEANPRFKELERLQRMSDDDLAARGLRREKLVEHVFRNSACI
ncbi:DUF1127 domain-containing protein [Mangrovicoccus ximenensis]|uniref:DUF1127 domain-containing protein n=1 Tax=Mangrovicoccus ximenensis TaxID=1911570 RepID=UPI000D33C31F|nr:DUF1127 domain-containing protein [Mangrovicoccus ximenensis]